MNADYYLDIYATRTDSATHIKATGDDNNEKAFKLVRKIVKSIPPPHVLHLITSGYWG